MAKPANNLSKFGRSFLVLSLMFLSGAHLSFIGPLFPMEASYKGVSKTVIGSVFGIFDLTCVIVGFLLPPILNYLKLETVFTAGLMLMSLCIIGFGLTTFLTQVWAYIVACTLLRVLIACGFSVSFFSTFPILFTLFPNKKGEVTALTQVFFELGMISGCCTEGLLYKWKGFGLPFIILGVMTLIIAILCALFLRLDDENESNSSENEPFVKTIEEEISGITMFDLLASPKILVATIPIFFSWTLQGTIFVYLTPFLRSVIGVSQSCIGFYFLPIAFTGLIASPILGKLVDKGQTWNLYLLSPVLGVLVCLFFLFISKLESHYVITTMLLIALALTSLCYVSGFIAGVNVLLEVLQNISPNSNCTAVMSAWNNMIIMSGRMFGSMVMGGLLFDFGGFSSVLWTQAGFHLISIAAAMLSSIFANKNRLYVVN